MKCDLERLLPHRAPMLLITDIESVDFQTETLVARVDVKETDVLYQKSMGGVPSWVGLEYMAQAIGCFVGLRDLEKNPDASPGVGFVLGSRNIDVEIPVFKVNQSYFVRVQSLFNDDNIASFDCVIYNDKNQNVAVGALNVFRPDDINDFMEGRNE